MTFSEKIPETKYTIRVKGILNGSDWSGWFGDMTVEQDVERGETVVQGMIMDPAELYGLISRLRNLGLILISVEPSNPVDQS
jgi:hypothetical protein